MKNWLQCIFVFALFILCSCSEKRNDDYPVSGKFQNSNNEMVYLQEISPEKVNIIDSAKLSDNGEFNFSAKIINPGFYNIKLGNENYITLILDSLSKVKITGDVKDLKNTYAVDGSEDTKIFMEINNFSKKAYQKRDSLSVVYEKYIRSSKFDSTKIDSLDQSIGKLFDSVMQKHNEYLIEVINKNPASIAMFAAIQQLDPDKYFSLYQKINDAISKKYPDLSFVKSYQKNIEEIKKTLIGSVAPSINLSDPDGKEVALSSLKGKYVLVDFWASWCQPCRVENPNLVKIYNKYKKSGLEIYSVSLDKDKMSWVSAIKKDNLTWLHVSDLAYWGSVAAKEYTVKSIPSNFLLDKNGIIIAKNIFGSELEKKLAEVLK